MILQSRQIFFTEARTFMVLSTIGRVTVLTDQAAGTITLKISFFHQGLILI